MIVSLFISLSRRRRRLSSPGYSSGGEGAESADVVLAAEDGRVLTTEDGAYMIDLEAVKT